MSNTLDWRGASRRGVLARLGGMLPSYRPARPAHPVERGGTTVPAPVRPCPAATRAAAVAPGPCGEVTLDTMLKAALIRLAEAIQRKQHAAGKSGHFAAAEAWVVDARHGVGELLRLVAAHGWPHEAKVGRDGLDAALVIACHARADEQSELLPALAYAVKTGGAPEAHLVHLSTLITLTSGTPLYDPTTPVDHAGQLETAGAAR
nr:hypothetical protein KPHV_86080 [Kitasatospora purpeofusca]